jgi:uncharacterized 2Fe-2S/4Fe-4S cluster protein (DUF4445 family)
MSFLIDFEPMGQRITCENGESILDAAQRGGVMLAAVCGGAGICKRCMVRIMSGAVTPPLSIETARLTEEEIADGWRLACHAKMLGDVRVYVPVESMTTSQRTQTECQDPKVDLDPVVHGIQVKIPAPSITDIRSDASRIRDALNDPELRFAGPVLRTLSSDLRAADFQPTVFVSNHQVVAVHPPHTTALGLAVDMGTTKLAGYLVDLSSGETLASAGRMNPQIAYGEDVVARISHAIRPSNNGENGAEQLRTTLVDAINELAGDLCAQCGRPASNILDAVLVGNTAIHHLFLGLPVRQLGYAPYVSAESEALDLNAREIGLDLAPGANVHLLPNIAGFVGADHVAMLLASDLPSRGNVVLGLDIGTNTEVSLLANGRHLTCSTASGPAFEGAHIRFGMRAAAGAIEKVLISDGRIMVKTIADQPPLGLCGSGILDLVAELRRAGLLSPRGAFNCNDGLFTPQGDAFIVVKGEQNGGKEITFSRKDVNEIQLAKGAMRAGINTLLQQAGVTEADIDEVVVAGAFGTYLDVTSGIEIGMFPQVDPRRFRQIGNASGAGARLALLSKAQRERARQIARKAEYIELMNHKGFSSIYAKALLLR